jgi:hypothetical protein
MGELTGDRGVQLFDVQWHGDAAKIHLNFTGSSLFPIR